VVKLLTTSLFSKPDTSDAIDDFKREGIAIQAGSSLPSARVIPANALAHKAFYDTF
jgi:hypothetical protein